jgi:hypothetical protein
MTLDLKGAKPTRRSCARSAIIAAAFFLDQ